MGFFNYFLTIVVISAFYSLFITTSIYNLDGVENVNIGIIVSFEESGANINYSQTSEQFQDAINTQTDFGTVDLAALALFSGNIIVDLAANFVFAFPNMVSLLITGVFLLLPVSGFLQTEIILWIKAILSIVGALFLLQFLIGVRSQSLGAV